MTTIKLQDVEYELKYTFSTHKKLGKIIKQSGEKSSEFVTKEENFPLIIHLCLEHSKPDATIQEVELALDQLSSFNEVMKLLEPYTKYYSDPNAHQPK